MVDQIFMRRPDDDVLLVLLSGWFLCVCVDPLKFQFT